MDLLITVAAVAAMLWILECLYPNVTQEKTARWYWRALIFNSAQAAIAISSAHLWDRWFKDWPLFTIKNTPIWLQVLAGYITITFVYYWWHRWRHSVPLLWRFLHQLHHSPVRIEVITSFYKSPLEILINGILTSAVLYILLGLSEIAVGACVLITALAELVYHMNLKTPHALGLFFQRPEMHRIHHQRGVHHYNYSDLPIWDMLFGTYRNPKIVKNETGFPNNNETKVLGLLTGKRFKV